MAWINITTIDGILVERIDTTDWHLDSPAARVSLMVKLAAAVKRAEELEGIKPEVFSSAVEAAGYCGVQTAPAPRNGAVVCANALPCEMHPDPRPAPETPADVADYVHGEVSSPQPEAALHAAGFQICSFWPHGAHGDCPGVSDGTEAGEGGR